MKNVDCLVDLKTDLYVQQEVLGQQFNIMVGGISGVIQFPCLNSIKSLDSLLPPNNEIWQDECVVKQCWGRIMNRPQFTAMIVKLGAYFTILDESGDQENIEKFIASFSDGWTTKFIDYCDIISRKYLYQPEIKQPNNNFMILYPLNSPTYQVQISIDIRDKWLSLQEIERAINFASDNSSCLPLSMELILKAQKAYAASNYRLAVVEAGTSADACLDELYKKYGPLELYLKENEKYEWTNFSLGRKFSTVIKNEIDGFPYTQKDAEEKIVCPRNGIAHNKASFMKPCRKDARNVVEAVEYLLRFVHPDFY